MGQIRKQTIQSSFLSYVGFLIGAINTYLFARKGLFTPDQYGLTQVFISMSQILAPLATFGMVAYMNKFFPYYHDNLENKKNDLLTVAIIFSLIGAILVFGGALIFKPFVVQKFAKKSTELVVEFYYWMLVFSFFYLCFLILESYLGTLKRTVLPNFMKETAYRLGVLILIGLYAFGLIDFRVFMIFFCCIYLLIVLIIVIYLFVTSQLHLSFKFSYITRRFKKSVRTYVSFIYAGIVINGIARQIDTLALAGAKSLTDTGIYSLNQYLAAILQVPYRGMQSIGGALIAQHWKNKNKKEIERIYKRSAINLLLISMFLFFNIWLNYDDGLKFLAIESKFAAGKTVFLILGIYNMMELGTGINGAVISTSPAWRFEFYSGLVLLAISIPLNIYMARWKGMDGVAMATFATFTVYNMIRLFFINKRFNMWPFSAKTVYAIVLAIGCYFIAYFLIQSYTGLGAIIARSFIFSSLFLTGAYYLQLTPDFHELLQIVKGRVKRKQNDL
jgi:O-antigen/teichoic acid export membrane protein